MAAANKEAAGTGGRGEPSAAERSRAGPSRAGPGPGARGLCGLPGRGRQTPEPSAPDHRGAPPRPRARGGRPAMAGVSYTAPWWVTLLHRLPHLNLRWEITSSQFRPEDTDYQQVTWAPGSRVRAPGHGPSFQRSKDTPPPPRVTALLLVDWVPPPRGSLSPSFLRVVKRPTFLYESLLPPLLEGLLGLGSLFFQGVRHPLPHWGPTALLQVLAFLWCCLGPLFWGPAEPPPSPLWSPLRQLSAPAQAPVHHRGCGGAGTGGSRRLLPGRAPYPWGPADLLGCPAVGGTHSAASGDTWPAWDWLPGAPEGGGLATGTQGGPQPGGLEGAEPGQSGGGGTLHSPLPSDQAVPMDPSAWGHAQPQRLPCP